MQKACSVDIVLFDFGGVIADEGFKEGLRAIARQNGVDEERFDNAAHEAIRTSNYLTGKAPEAAFWALLRKLTGIQGTDTDLRNECLSRFIIRDWMLELAGRLRDRGIRTGILSDQTDWLDLLNDRYDFFRYYDHVFNSYHMGDGKWNPGHFDAVCQTLGVSAGQVLFIDDTPGHCERASQRGLNVILYTGRNDFEEKIGAFCPLLENI
ncbi:MAG: hypothetical protein CSYNP_01668 [Syntrophus sp. SKADARSKE-3]|nr:hypothetical protein [Syntrophus sp. SKADARSKE-3]